MQTVCKIFDCRWSCFEGGTTHGQSGSQRNVPTVAKIVKREVTEAKLIHDTQKDDLFELMVRWDGTVMQMVTEMRVLYIPIGVFV